MRSAVVRSDLRVWPYTAVNSPALSREIHHWQWGRRPQEGNAPWFALTTTRIHQPASRGKYSWNLLLLITKAGVPPCCSFQYLCPALQLSATIQPPVSQRCCIGICDAKILCILITLVGVFFQHNGAFMSSQALFSWWLVFSRHQIWKIILYSAFCYAASHSSISFALQ